MNELMSARPTASAPLARGRPADGGRVSCYGYV